MKKEKRRKKKEKDIRQEWKVNVGKKMVKEKYKKETIKMLKFNILTCFIHHFWVDIDFGNNRHG